MADDGLTRALEKLVDCEGDVKIHKDRANAFREDGQTARKELLEVTR